jgi:hypothetical protein
VGVDDIVLADRARNGGSASGLNSGMSMPHFFWNVLPAGIRIERGWGAGWVGGMSDVSHVVS